MSLESQHHIYRNVIPVGTQEDAMSVPVFVEGFKTVKFTLSAGLDPDFDVNVLQSDDNDPNLEPDPTDATPVEYVDQENGEAYALDGAPFNPAGTPFKKTFNVEITGARWIFIQILNYSAGRINQCDVNPYSNFT